MAYSSNSSRTRGEPGSAAKAACDRVTDSATACSCVLVPPVPSQGKVPYTCMLPHCEVAVASSRSACAAASEAEARKPAAAGAPAATAPPGMRPVCRAMKAGTVAGAGVRRGVAKHCTWLAVSAAGFSSHTGTCWPSVPGAATRSPV